MHAAMDVEGSELCNEDAACGGAMCSAARGPAGASDEAASFSFRHSPTARPSVPCSTRSSTASGAHPRPRSSARTVVELRPAVSPSPFLRTPPPFASARTPKSFVDAAWFWAIMAAPSRFQLSHSWAETAQPTSCATALHMSTREAAVIHCSSLPPTFFTLLLTKWSGATAKYPATTRTSPRASSFCFASSSACTWPAWTGQKQPLKTMIAGAGSEALGMGRHKCGTALSQRGRSL
mmetsp:Transcript_56951/g.114279  ORF Transcript_56951/g.114279 Transcript_56951/m.114279 type:complete len:236 (+) Transcript_56951:550-1257(+)